MLDEGTGTDSLIVINQNNSKQGKLKPVDQRMNKSKPKLKNDPHKRLMDQVQQLTNISEINSNSNNTSINKSITSRFEDKDFRKTFTKTEKILIDCDPKQIMSKSLIKFDTNYDENEAMKSENRFNNLVRNQLLMEYHQVNDFLDSIGMVKYLDVFILNGFEDLDKIVESIICTIKIRFN